jgi:hypothetical protein
MGMETTVILSKVLGAYIIIAGAIILLRKEYFVPVMGHFVQEKLLRIIIAFCELLAGLFLVALHFDFSSMPAGIISMLGVAAVLEGIAYLALPDKTLTKWVKLFNKPSLYLWWGIAALALGLYLVGYGFGLM